MSEPPDERPTRVDEITTDAQEPEGRAIAKIAAGVVLVLVGILWLLDQLDVAVIPWRGLLPAGLIAIGVILVLTAGRRTGHGTLITLGVVLTLVLTVSWGARSILDVRLSGGFGERTERPTSPAQLQSEYHLGIGKLVVDLREVSFTSNRTIEASVGIGELQVLVPPDVTVDAEGKAGIGEVDLSACEGSGLGVEEACSLEGSEVRLELSGRVGVGQVEVSR